ncbi:hypothetical protein DCAR_0208382 [Daucus carota subsp. sativus]|uniref:Pentacotripeptide-repeat region of PRORP domain-containing protein n=1 Tax=Daucus carota subsp. sativus TaxID=79200 RepID=A0AAF1AQZ6_DAUCS|nr:hypothetical protein DCAR_0208382 [Daucus carota subsp. sativus]
MLQLLRYTILYTTKAANHILSRAITPHIYRMFSAHQDFDFHKIYLYPFVKKLHSISFDSNFIHDNTPYVFTKFVSQSAKLGSLDLGIQLHCTVIKMGFSSNLFITTSLVDMYGKCGDVLHAQQLFDEMPRRNVVTWNSLISGYVNAQISEMAIEIFVVMLHMGVVVTAHSLSTVLVGCAQLKDGRLGGQVHGLCLKTGFELNDVVGTSLIDMYSKCLDVEASRRIFDRMVERNIVTWTSLVGGYSLTQQSDEAMILVRDMLRWGVRANFVTYNCLLSSFSFPEDFNHFKQVHCCIIREGLESNRYLSVSLMTLYSESGNAENFLNICSTLKIWDQISWNAVIAGFAKLGKGEDALDCYFKMRQEGINIDVYTLSGILKAMGLIAALEEGRQTHGIVFKCGHTSNLCVQNALVSMYAKCGKIVDAEKVFLSIEEHDLVSWNSLLAGCAYNGYGSKAVGLFEQMRRTIVKPDLTSFLAVLTACSYEGLLDKGLEYFDMMRNDDSLEPPKLEHYACIVNLYARAGYIHEAESFIISMSVKPGPTVYKTLLSACQIYGNKEIAIRNATKLIELCPYDDATYVLISNVMATGGYWDDAAELRKLMYDRGVKKQPAHSWISSRKNKPNLILSNELTAVC